MKARICITAAALFGTGLIGYGQPRDLLMDPLMPPSGGTMGSPAGPASRDQSLIQPMPGINHGGDVANLRSPMDNANWDDAQESQVPLNQVPQHAQDTLKKVAAGARISDPVTQLTKNGNPIYRATVSHAGREDLQVYVNQDGSVLQTRQRIPFSEAPASVRDAVRQQLGGSEPQQFHRIIAAGETSYVATAGQGGQAKTIRVDHTGNLQR